MIDIDDLINEIHSVCGDMSHTKEESLEAYEEIADFARASAAALREDIAREPATNTSLDEED